MSRWLMKTHTECFIYCKSAMRVGNSDIYYEENITHDDIMEGLNTFQAGLLLPVVESIQER